MKLLSNLVQKVILQNWKVVNSWGKKLKEEVEKLDVAYTS
jgi:hypothetical protein